ncbi:MAG TPA: response regulator [Steroidobacteraceae bacterium]|nr:response regulator [Steroidobacteraceae bacterium]
MTNPSSGQARDPVEKLTRAQLIQRLREAEASLDAVHDGSDLKSTRARLAEEIEARARAEGDFQVALDAAGMGSWELFLATGAVRRSLRHDQIFGYGALQLSWHLNTTVERFLADDRSLVEHAFAQAELSGSVDVEARIRRASDGEIRWVHINGQTFYADEAPTRIAGVIADVTHRRAVEERLRQAQKIEAIGQLTGGVAHDFNNLLQVISGGLQIMGRPGDPAAHERVFNAMKQAVERGASLCRQLLAFARRQPLRPEPVDLNRLIVAMRELLDRSLRGDVQFRSEFAEDLWPVEVDPGELELVILNLAVNARDAMPTGGIVTISAYNSPALADHELTGDFVRLDITDTGVGMAADVLSHAFEPFFTTKEVGKGSGLGLAQAHGFARASKGAVRIDSTLGCGTKVSVFLPRTLKTPACCADPMIDRSLETVTSAGQVLLVEDDDEVAALTVEMINQLGYDTTRVASAEAALGALADKRAIDIVLSDVMMPGRMNGVDLAQEIRRRRPHLPVLLTSGYAEAASRSAAAHQIRIIAKPFRMEELREALATVKREHSQETL